MCSKCKVITVSIEWYDLEAAVTPARLWILLRCILVSLSTVLAPPQLVHPVVLARRRAGSRSGRNRFGDEDLVWVGGGRGRCRQREVGRPLDGRFVVSSQDAQAGGLLLGLLRLLLTLQLLMEHQLNVLLRQGKQTGCQSTRNTDFKNKWTVAPFSLALIIKKKS